MFERILTDLLHFVVAGAFIWLPLVILVRLQAWAVRYAPLPWLYPFAIIGVPVHELSHAIAALLSGHKIIKIELFKPDESGTLGYVEHSYKVGVLSWFSNLFVGLAPLIGGGFVIWLLTWLLMPGVPLTPRFQTEISLVEALLETFTNINTIISMAGNDGKSWLWLYLVVSVSMFMVPSKPDFHGAAKGILALALLSFGSYLFFSDSFLTFTSVAQTTAMLALPLVVMASVVMAIFIMLSLIGRWLFTRK